MDSNKLRSGTRKTPKRKRIAAATGNGSEPAVELDVRSMCNWRVKRRNQSNRRWPSATFRAGCWCQCPATRKKSTVRVGRLCARRKSRERKRKFHSFSPLHTSTHDTHAQDLTSNRTLLSAPTVPQRLLGYRWAILQSDGASSRTRTKCQKSNRTEANHPDN